MHATNQTSWSSFRDRCAKRPATSADRSEVADPRTAGAPSDGLAGDRGQDPHRGWPGDSHRFEATAVASGSADAVMSVDALQYAPDKTKALIEVARILRPGGRFAFVTFELDAEHVAGLPVWNDPVSDYRPILGATGFETLSYDQIPKWREHVTAGFGAVVAEQHQLELELGPVAAAGAVAEASITLGLQPYCGHVLAVAMRV